MVEYEDTDKQRYNDFFLNALSPNVFTIKKKIAYTDNTNRQKCCDRRKEA